MRRVLLGVLCCCVLASLAVLNSPAKAGDYYGYRSSRASGVWHTSSCCYRKIVRHATTVRYVRVRSYRYYHGDYGRPYRYGNYERPYRYYRPWRHYRTRYSYGDRTWPRRHDRGYRHANYVSPPDCRLVRIADIDGGWVWARRAGCF